MTVSVVVPGVAADPAPEEVKAAFAFRLCQFVSWPPGEQTSPFVIGVVGERDAVEPLETVTRGKQIGGRPIEIRRFSRLSALEPADAVFVSEKYRRWTNRVLAFYQDSATLTIGEYSDFPERGGVAGLYWKDGQLALELNHEAAVLAGLSLSPKLLAVAERVVGKP